MVPVESTGVPGISPEFWKDYYIPYCRYAAAAVADATDVFLVCLGIFGVFCLALWFWSRSDKSSYRRLADREDRAESEGSEDRAESEGQTQFRYI